MGTQEILHMLSELDNLKILYYIVNSEHHYDKYIESLKRVSGVFKEIRDEKPEGSNERKILDVFIDKLDSTIESIPNPYTVLDSVIGNYLTLTDKPGTLTGNPQCGLVQDLVDNKRREIIQSLIKGAEDEYNKYRENLMKIVGVLESLRDKTSPDDASEFIEGLKSLISSIPSPFEVLVKAYNETIKHNI
jgi:hypothetical protein